MATIPGLDVYNQEVLACQQEAFTLALYLLGNDHAADDVVQRSVMAAYRCCRRSPDQPIRLTILREVIRLCDHHTGRPEDGLSSHLRRLSRRECRSLLLIDLLGLSYDQAAHVLRCKKHDLAQWLARARANLATSWSQ